MGVISQIASHATAAKAKLMGQFKSFVQLGWLIEAFGVELDAAETALWDLYTKVMDINAAEGVQLDNLGKIIGESRGTSANDAEYRLRLRAAIRAKLSKGRAEDVYLMFEVLMAATQSARAGAQMTASIEYQIFGATAAAMGLVMLRFLRRSTAGDQYVTMEWSESEDAATFRTEDWSATVVSQLNGAIVPGATSILLDHTIGFPINGLLVIEPGAGNQETVYYDSIDGGLGGTLLEDVGQAGYLPVLFNHADNALVAIAVAPMTYGSAVGLAAGTHLTGAVAPSDTTLNVTDTSAFPSYGTLVLGEGTANVEECTYSGVTATTFTGCSGVDLSHANGDEVSGGEYVGRLAALNVAA